MVRYYKLQNNTMCAGRETHSNWIYINCHMLWCSLCIRSITMPHKLDLKYTYTNFWLFCSKHIWIKKPYSILPVEIETKAIFYIKKWVYLDVSLVKLNSWLLFHLPLNFWSCKFVVCSLEWVNDEYFLNAFL